MNNEELARAAAVNVLKMMAVKWTVVIVTTQIAKRLARKLEP